MINLYETYQVVEIQAKDFDVDRTFLAYKIDT